MAKKKTTKDTTPGEKFDDYWVVGDDERAQLARVQDVLRREIPPGLPYGDELGWKRDEKRRKRDEEGIKELAQLLADLINPANPLPSEMCAIIEEASPVFLVEGVHISLRAVRGYKPERQRGYNETEEAAFDVPAGRTLIQCRLTDRYFTLPADGVYPVVEYRGRIGDDGELWDHDIPFHPRLLNQPPAVLQAALLHEAKERIGYAMQYLNQAVEYFQVATLPGAEGLQCGGWPDKAFQTEEVRYVDTEEGVRAQRKFHEVGWTDVEPRKVA